MKKLLLVFAILVFVVPAMAQTWHTANQVTLAWDAVPPPVDSSNNPLPGDIKYQCYIKFQSSAAEAVKVGSEIEETQQAISFSAEGRYYLCAQALRYPPNETEPVKSTLSCTHDPAVTATGQAFGVKYFVPPGQANKLRLQ